MRYLLLFCGMFIGGLFLTVIKADVPQDKLNRISQALADKNWDEVNKLFGQVVKENPQKAEDFFWFQVDTACPSRKSMACNLAEHYRKYRNFEKAAIFYNELVKIVPSDTDYLSKCAEMEILNGKEKKALELYKQILKLDSNHLSANIFTGNYYYFVSLREKKQLDSEYAKLQAPTRMQYAEYQVRLESLFNTGFKKARTYLEKVITFFPSSEIKKTLDKIKKLEQEMK